jgi:DNA polymerase IV
MREILHIDMDAFYASIEQRDDPSLHGRPVIVGADPKGGSGRGVVAACSYEARRFGVHSALPISQAWGRCPNAVYLRPRMSRYVAVSKQIMAIFRSYTDLVEPLSIDEAFLDVTGSTRALGTPSSIARKIKTDVREQTGLTASAGIAPNKFLAKVASELGKPDGFVVVEPDSAKAFLAPLPVRMLWGVGPRMAARLESAGLRTIGQIAAISPAELTERLGISGECLRRLACGEDERPVAPHRAVRSISRETTFNEDVGDAAVLRLTLRTLADEVARRLRDRGLRARTITLKLRYSDFTTYTRQVSRPGGIDGSRDIYSHALDLLSGFDLSRPVRLLGVGTVGLEGTVGGRQMSLFENDPRPGRIDRVLDTVRSRYGDGSIRRASTLG